MIKTDLREALEVLRSSHRALRSKPCSETHQPFYQALKEASALLGSNEESVVSKAVACYWLDHFANTLVNALNHFAYKDDIDLFIGLVVRNNIVRELTQNIRAEKVLACICVSRVLIKTEGISRQENDHPEHNNVENLLTQWLDIDVPPEALSSVPVLTDLLYGTGVWALYGGDVSWPEDSPSFLYRLNLPVVHKQPSPAALNVGVTALPGDLF